MSSPNIRRFTPDDYQDIVNIYNTLFPDQLKTAAEWKESDATLAINRRLGFTKRPDIVEFEKVCRKDTPSPEMQKEHHCD